MGPWLNRLVNPEPKENEPPKPKGQSGIVDTYKYRFFWWIVPEKADVNPGYYPCAGHVAALFQNELYGMIEHNKGANQVLQYFSINHGYKRIVIYVEFKEVDGVRVRANAERTRLVVGDLDEGLPWKEVGEVFFQNMPKEISDYQAEEAAKITSKSKDNHNDRLKPYIDEMLSNATTYIEYKKGKLKTNSNNKTGEVNGTPGKEIKEDEDKNKDKKDKDKKGNPNKTKAKKSGKPDKPRSLKDGKSRDIFEKHAKSGDIAIAEIGLQETPQVQWTDNSGSAGKELASYDKNQNMIFINKDHILIRRASIINFAKCVAGTPAFFVETEVERAFEKRVVDAVTLVFILHKQGHINSDEKDEMLTPDKLTMTGLQIESLTKEIERNLGSALNRKRSKYNSQE